MEQTAVLTFGPDWQHRGQCPPPPPPRYCRRAAVCRAPRDRSDRPSSTAPALDQLDDELLQRSVIVGGVAQCCRIEPGLSCHRRMPSSARRTACRHLRSGRLHAGCDIVMISRRQGSSVRFSRSAAPYRRRSVPALADLDQLQPLAAGLLSRCRVPRGTVMLCPALSLSSSPSCWISASPSTITHVSSRPG